MGTSGKHCNGNFSAGPGWRSPPWKHRCRGHLGPEAARSLNGDRCRSPTAEQSSTRRRTLLQEPEERSQGSSLCPPAHAGPCFQPHGIREMTGIESIAKGKVSHSCCQPRRRQGAGSSKRREPSPSPSAGFASSGLRLHLEFKNTQGQNSPGSRRLARAQPQGSAMSIKGGARCQPPSWLCFISQWLGCQTSPGLGNYSRSQPLRNMPHACLNSRLQQPIAVPVGPAAPGAAPRSDRLPSLAKDKGGNRCAGR